MTSDYSFTKHRIFQWMGILLALGLIAVGYWYFRASAGVKINSSLTDPLSEGLAGYWKLDEGSGTSATDASTNGNTGTLTNGPTWTTGQIGGAVDFDGSNDYVTMPDNNVVDVTDGQNFSISGWFNRDTFTSNHVILAKKNTVTSAGDIGYGVYIGDTSDKLTLSISDGTDTYLLESSSTFTTTGWHHFVASWDDTGAANTKIYINGTVESATATGTFANVNSFTNGATIKIGADSNGGVNFDGKLDEVRIYNRALSVDEVADLYRLTSPTGVDTGLKGYWSFNAQDMPTSTTAADSSGAGNTGTLTNGPTKTIGKVGQALSFDGTDDYTTVADANSLDITSAISMAVWIKTTDANGCIMSKGTSSTYKCFDLSTNKVYELGILSSTLYFQTSNGTTTNVVSGSATPLLDNQWHHVVGAWDGTTTTNGMKIYIDGAVSYQGTATVTTIQSTNSSLAFGYGSTYYLSGSIDEGRLYNRALSAAEIQSLYDAGESDKTNSSVSQPQGTGRLDSGLAGYWKLDDGSGTSATDSSTNGNTGTLTNGPTWTTGQIGGAVQFDNTNDSVQVADASNLSFTNGSGTDLPYSVSAWVYMNDITEFAGIAGKWIQTGNSMEWVLRNAGSIISFQNYHSNSTSNVIGRTAPISTGSHQGHWIHVTGTYDGSESSTGMAIYIDGARADTADSGAGAYTGMSNTTAPVEIGAYNSGSNIFNGSIDEVRIYNRALSADEVANLYRLTSPTGTDTSLKGYWSFNGQDISGTTAYDRSGAGNTGTLTNGPAKTIGKLGQALNFDGTDDYVDAGSADSLDNITTKTVTAWIYPQTTGEGGIGNIMRKGASDTSSSWTFQFSAYSSGKLGFTTAFSTQDGYWTGSTGLTMNNWHFVAVTYDRSSSSNTPTFYVNGVQETVTSNAPPSGSADSDASGNLMVGGRSDARRFKGSIDEVRIYNTALTAAQIKSLYDAGESDKTNTSASQPQGTGRFDSDLAGYWALDNGSGTSATDSSTNANTGTFTNGPAWTTGQIGSAVDFDGTDDYIDLGSSKTYIDTAKPFTVSLWVNSDVVDTSFKPAFSFKSTDTNAWRGFITNSNPYLDFTFGLSSSSSKRISFPGGYTTGTWRYVTITYSGAGIDTTASYSAYIDGASTVVNSSDALTVANNENYIGACNSSGSFTYWNGKLDEVRIYNRALSADEVAQLYRLTSPTGTDTSLKGYWSFNGQDISGTTAYDRSGAGNTGTLTGGPTKALGKIGQALSLDGSNDYASFGSATSIKFGSGDFTYAIWMKTSATGDNSIVFGEDQAENAYRRILINSSSFPVCSFRDATANAVTVTGSASVEDGIWHHVICVRSGTTGYLYVDGVLIGSNTNGSVGNTNTSSGNLVVGYRQNGGGDLFYTGFLDEARAYNRALSAAEIQSLYNSSR